MRGKQFNMGWSEAFFELNTRIVQSSMFAPLIINIIKLIDGVILFLLVIVNNSEVNNVDQSSKLGFWASLFIHV